MSKKSLMMVMGLLVLTVFIFSGCSTNGPTNEISTLNVNGTGKITTEPDTVEIRISIVSDGKTKDVQEENANKAQAIIDELIKLGLEKKEIETQNINFYPLKKWTEKDGEVTTGFRAENTIVVKTTKIEKAGSITDTAVRNGAQNVGNLVFSLSDAGKEKLLDKAIEVAVADAKKQAEATAKALGVNISGVKNVNVIKSSVGSPVYLESRQFMAAADMATETPIMPQDTEYMVTVDVAFMIK
ncbi:MAG: SIMPL domain-containing protein [Peptococcales bacterium]|jgi:uncharacterized protein YggE